MYLIDSHCHLDLLNDFFLHQNLISILEKSYAYNVNFFLCVSTSLSGFNLMVKKIGYHKNIFFSCGTHPLNIDNLHNFNELKRLSSNKNVIALGETGLDYFYKYDNKIKQQEIFYQHIFLSNKLNKPLIIHARHSYKDILTILHQEKKKNNFEGVVHSFSGDITNAKTLLDLNFYISLSGIVTFNNSETIRTIARYIPLNKLLIETDSPYLSPVPYRGKQNHPAYLHKIAEYIAILKNINLYKMVKINNINFCKLFNISI